jgi:hypothetical protein
MPKNSCPPCPPDNCYKECVEACIENCKKQCCDRKYRKLACKLLETGLFVDTANYNVARNHSASSDGAFYNLLQHFANADLDCGDLTAVSPLITNNQPANSNVYLSQGIWSGVNIYQFTKEQWNNFNAITANIADFTFIASPIVKYILGRNPQAGLTYQDLYTDDTLQPNQTAYVNSLLAAVDQIELQLGQAAQTILSSSTAVNTPYTIEVRYTLVDPLPSPLGGGKLLGFNGKASLITKANSGLVNSCLDDDCVYLMYTGSRVVDVCPPLPPVPPGPFPPGPFPPGPFPPVPPGPL